MGVTLQRALGITPDHAHYLPSALLPSNNLVGVEVELENIGRNGTQPLNYWSITRDGSLRNNGVEFVLAHPTCGQTLIDAFGELGKYLENFTPEASDRTSVHVHLDFRSNTMDQTFQFLMMYAILERTLIKYAGGEARANSIYCIPLHKSYETMRLWGCLNEKVMGTGKMRSGSELAKRACQSAVGNAEKYAACNIKPLNSFGSIEIRIHKGEKDPKRLLEWVQILLALKLYTDTVQIDFDDMFNTMSEEGYSGILPAIFGHTDQCELLSSQTDVDMDLGRGMRVAQDILHLWTMSHRSQPFPKDVVFTGNGERGHPLLEKKAGRKAPKRPSKGPSYVDMEGTRHFLEPGTMTLNTAFEATGGGATPRATGRRHTTTFNPFEAPPVPEVARDEDDEDEPEEEF